MFCTASAFKSIASFKKPDIGGCQEEMRSIFRMVIIIGCSVLAGIALIIMLVLLFRFSVTIAKLHYANVSRKALRTMANNSNTAVRSLGKRDKKDIPLQGV